MYNLLVIFFLIIYFWIVSLLSDKVEMAEKSKKVFNILDKIIKFSPILGVIVFSILFTFILNTQLPERISHSIFVFSLWMYATKFYLNMISYFKRFKILVMSIFGMLLFTAVAVLYTPLDRYVDLIYVYIGEWSIVVGILIFVNYYITGLFTRKINNNKIMKNI